MLAPESKPITKFAIVPHSEFDLFRPDEVAECWDGVYSFGNLYEQLWACVEKYDEDEHRENIEDMCPDDVRGINALSRYWDFISDENKLKLNELAQQRSKYYAELLKD